MKLIKTLRWFGKNDPVTLREIRQTGATGIVTALHHIPNGEIWPIDEIEKMKAEIESHDLSWEVVESLPVHEAIKKGDSKREQFIKNYKQSIQNLGDCGIRTICYNFMPVLDWARTNLHYTLENGVEAMYFDVSLFAAFDLFILKRKNAEKDYSQSQIINAKQSFESLSKEEVDTLGYNIIIKTQSFIDGALNDGKENYLEAFNDLLAEYDHIDKYKLRENFAYFLNEVIPIAEEAAVRLAVHPDDPPFPLLGLPRIISSDSDFEWLARICPSLNNGITFCTGSLGASKDNKLPELLKKYGDRVHFLHLRSTQILENGNFYEDNHLEGSSAMHRIMKTVLEEQFKRKKEGRIDVDIPFRPDHGHKILDDFNKDANPGYPLIGRLKGLAELSGLEVGIRYMMQNQKSKK